MKTPLEIIRQCQRNWNQNDLPTAEHVQIIVNSVVNAPHKNNLRYYSLIVIQNSSIRDKFARVTEPQMVKPNDAVKQTQVYAPLLLVFVRDQHLIENQIKQGYHKDSFCDMIQNVHVGIGATCAAITAAELGYRTGYCQCFGNSKKLLAEYKIKGDIQLMLGIGKPNEGVPYHIKPKSGQQLIASEHGVDYNPKKNNSCDPVIYML